MTRSITSLFRFALAAFAACTLMVSLGCSDIKPDADSTGDAKTKTPASSNRGNAADGQGATPGAATEAK